MESTPPTVESYAVALRTALDVLCGTKPPNAFFMLTVVVPPGHPADLIDAITHHLQINTPVDYEARSRLVDRIRVELSSVRSRMRDEDRRVPRFAPVPEPRPPRTALDIQIGGNHYKDFAIQPVEFITRNGLGFCAGNVIKYTCRYQKKGGIEDLRKARHYLDLLIELTEGKPDGKVP